MNTTTTNKPWRVEQSDYAGEHTYRILGGDGVPTVIAERTTGGKSPGTLATFTQICREHNEHSALVAVAEALRLVLRHCVSVSGVPDKGHGRTDEQQAAMDAARTALSALRNGKEAK